MDIREAEKIVRKEKNVKSVYYAFNKGADWYFVVSPHPKPFSGDPESFMIKITENGKTESKKFFNVDSDNKIFLDMDPDEYGLILEY